MLFLSRPSRKPLFVVCFRLLKDHLLPVSRIHTLDSRSNIKDIRLLLAKFGSEKVPFKQENKRIEALSDLLLHMGLRAAYHLTNRSPRSFIKSLVSIMHLGEGTWVVLFLAEHFSFHKCHAHEFRLAPPADFLDIKADCYGISSETIMARDSCLHI